MPRSRRQNDAQRRRAQCPQLEIAFEALLPLVLLRSACHALRRGEWLTMTAKRASAFQQDVLRVLSLGAEQILSSDVRDRYGLPTASSIQRALDALVGRGLLVRNKDGFRFDSPFMREWVRREAAPGIG
jgi:hypothetical protein